jgi:predicted phosphodiesterase
MKLLTIGDLHYNVRQYDWVVANAASYDMIIIAGDLLNIAGHLDLDTQILVVNKYLQRLKVATTVLACSGNHDGDRKGEGGELFADWLDTDSLEGIHGDGASVRRDGWLFSICPWWDGPVGQARVEAFLEAEAAKVADAWFVIHHDASNAINTSSHHLGQSQPILIRTPPIFGWIPVVSQTALLRISNAVSL